jgi:hypothetical protein
MARHAAEDKQRQQEDKEIAAIMSSTVTAQQASRVQQVSLSACTIKEDTKVFHPISTTKPPTNYLPLINTQVSSVHVHPMILRLGDDILSKSYLKSIIPILQ